MQVGQLWWNNHQWLFSSSEMIVKWHDKEIWINPKSLNSLKCKMQVSFDGIVTSPTWETSSAPSQKKSTLSTLDSWNMCDPKTSNKRHPTKPGLRRKRRWNLFRCFNKPTNGVTAEKKLGAIARVQESRATAIAKSERLLMTSMLEEFTDPSIFKPSLWDVCCCGFSGILPGGRSSGVSGETPWDVKVCL